MIDPAAREALAALVELNVPLPQIAASMRSNVGALRAWIEGGEIEAAAAERLSLVAQAVTRLAVRVREIDREPDRPIRTHPPLGEGFARLLENMRARDASHANEDRS